IDHCNTRARGNVVLIDTATSGDANAKSVGIFRRDHLKRSARSFGGINSRLAHDPDRHAEVWPTRGYARHHRNLPHTWHSLDTFEHLPVIRSDLIWPLQSFIRHRQLERQYVFGTNAEVHPRQVPKTLQCESTAG